MTNGLPMPAPICCPTGGGGDLMPLLLVVVVLLAGHVAIQEFKKRNGKPEMKNFKNLAIVAAVIVAAGIVFALKQNQNEPAAAAPAADAESVSAEAGAPQSAALPRLVDLGADKCIPCKMMAPILDELKTAYAGQFEVEFIDVWKNPDAGEQYGIRSIPTQIFYDANGKELFRHEGFFPKEDILSKWKELGVELVPPAAQTL
jgi:thioredoxin 1